MFKKIYITNLFFSIAVIICSNAGFAQRSQTDSLLNLLRNESKDSNKVTLMWKLATIFQNHDPDTARILAQKALILAEKIKFIEGESRSLGVMANSFINIGNYPRALEFYIRKLKLEEKRNNPRNMASAIMDIGIVHVYQQEYRQALIYYYLSDSVIQTNNIDELKYNIALNIGDVYNRLNSIDTAFGYFKKALEISKNDDSKGAAMIGLGHVYFQERNFKAAMENYKGAKDLLIHADDEDLACEAILGLAKLYDTLKIYDTAVQYAKITLALSKKDGFLSWELESINFLKDYYRSSHNTDSAYAYLSLSQSLKDSINSIDKIKETQVIFSNEQMRQLELAETKRKAIAERKQQLQMLFIGIFIPGLFLFTLFLSKRKIHIRVIRFMGILSLLMLFEYLTLLLHPYVLELTNHIPVFEILIFVTIAAVLVPSHHRIEHWLIEKLTHRKHRLREAVFNIHKQKIKIKKTSS